MPTSPDLSKSNELLIIGLAQTGDRSAFGELVRRRQGWIRTLMRQCCGDPSLADDLAQQAFLQAWRDISKLRNPRSFGAWLKRLAINTWLMHLRSEKPRENMEDEHVHAGDPTSMNLDLNSALDRLSPAVRLCVVLSYHEGMSHSEIAEVADLPVGTVKSHIRRGSETLRQILAAYADKPAKDPI